MIKCRKCGRPLTEFDIELYKNLRKTDSLYGIVCSNCLVGNKIQRTIYWKNHAKKYTFFYIAPILTILGIIFLGCLNLIPQEIFLTENHWGYSFVMAVFLISTVGGTFVFLRDSNAFSEFMAGPTRIGQHYEMTSHYDGLNWVSTTKKVTDYDFMPQIKPFLVFFTFMFWSGFFWLFSMIRYLIVCPIRVKFAYAKTKRTVDDATVSLKTRIAYHMHNKNYNLRLKKVKKKYSYLAKSQLQEKLNAIKKKYTVTRIAGKKAIVHTIQGKQIIVVTKKNDMIFIRNVFGNSFVYDDNVNICDLGISPDIIEQCKKML